VVGDGKIDMMSSHHLRIVTSTAMKAFEPPRQTLRLKLKPKAPATGFVDGAWWPRSRDLSAELPALLAVLAVRLGPIQRVSYNLVSWDGAPRRLDIGGRQVRLGGFQVQHPNTVDVIGSNASRLILLVLPPGTEPVAAHRILMTASRRENSDGIDRLLPPVPEATARRASSDLPGDPAMERWEIDGGAGYDGPDKVGPYRVST
jgi:hypothetical protein